ncbi:MAG: hypothetical protein CBD94_01590 [Gammaproteobacteria bacterium TMED234]|jgi:hypothetical protein|nr:MAG: hypothetical protein CBD94_01590 [Gammaproteobacteria bacterium TMED234]|tara:strand:+ start:248 stop:535 length:288 start_codon:yes stop_codon:yes gene_type:complete
MPAILEDAVKSIMKDNPGMKEGAAYAIATKTLQKSGDLKDGTVQATEKGKRRGEMSKATRAKTRAEKYKIEREKERKGEAKSRDGRDERSTSGRL